ncbi:hypothetical protein ABZ714_30805 [Streptomyces sp. NPDC006798]|uniref:hypothetical protein n=1 Tax=Streptomyces sp. NPDC006798 TaxID=3155462 RepID=UPI0033C1DDD9
MPEIYDNDPGRTFGNYDLLNDITTQYDIDRTQAHELIHAMLNGLVQDDPNVILDRQPVHPGRLVSNPNDLDIRHWLIVSDDTEQTIRDAIAAVMAHQD